MPYYKELLLTFCSEQVIREQELTEAEAAMVLSGLEDRIVPLTVVLEGDTAQERERAEYWLLLKVRLEERRLLAQVARSEQRSVRRRGSDVQGERRDNRSVRARRFVARLEYLYEAVQSLTARLHHVPTFQELVSLPHLSLAEQDVRDVLLTMRINRTQVGERIYDTLEPLIRET